MHPGREGERTGFAKREVDCGWKTDRRLLPGYSPPAWLVACLGAFVPPSSLSTFVPGGFFSREWW